MATKEFIIQSLKKEIEKLGAPPEEARIGTVVEVADGVARMTGLTDCLSAEMLEFPGGTYGVALNLEEETVGAVILGDSTAIKEGDTVKTTGRVVEVPVGQALLGRVVNILHR